MSIKSARDQQFMLLVITLIVSIAIFLLGAYNLFRYGGGLVETQDDTVGEMLLDEGLRRLAAGDRKSAWEHLVLADEARFEGSKNRRHLDKLMGDLLLERGEALAAESRYAAAAEDWALAEIEPVLLAEAVAGHAELLLRAGALPELAAWLASRPAGVPTGEFPLVDKTQRLYRILLALEQADDSAIRSWQEAFHERTNLDWSWAPIADTLDSVDAFDLWQQALVAPIAVVREHAARALPSAIDGAI